MPYDPNAPTRQPLTERRSVTLRPRDVQQLKQIAAINGTGISVIIRRAMLHGLEAARQEELTHQDQLRKSAEEKQQRKNRVPPFQGKEHETRRLLAQRIPKRVIAKEMDVPRPTLHKFIKTPRPAAEADPVAGFLRVRSS